MHLFGNHSKLGVFGSLGAILGWLPSKAFSSIWGTMVKLRTFHFEALGMSKLIFAAIDSGNGETKAVRWKDAKRSGFIYQIMPSIISHAKPHVSLLGNKEAPPVYLIDGTQITVSAEAIDQIDIVKTGNFSPERKALALEGLSRLGLGGREIAVATNIPLQDALTRNKFQIAETDTKALKQKSDLLCRGAVEKLGGVPPLIVKAICQAEGFAAYVDHVVANNGAVKEHENGMTAFIDMGAGTTNIGLMKKGFELADHFTTLRRGTNDILDALGELIQSKFQMNLQSFKLERFERTMLKEALLTKSINFIGRKHNIEDLVEEAKRQFARDVELHARSIIADHISNVREILLVGGGGVFLKDAFNDWPELTVPEQPQFANARGLLKILTYMTKLNATTEGFLAEQLEAVG